MDPFAGIIGACVIGSWSYGLIRDTGAILLDSNPDKRMAEKLRQVIEGEGDQLADLHLWRLGPGHLAAIISIITGAGSELLPRAIGKISITVACYDRSRTTIFINQFCRGMPGGITTGRGPSRRWRKEKAA
jgi:Co/Zn/Cd efflux system component